MSLGCKYVFLDVDGTLLPFGKPVPDSAVDALQKAHEKGNKLFLCTGRSRNELPGCITALPFDGMVLGAGALLYAEGELVSSKAFDNRQLARFVTYCQAHEVGMYLQTEAITYTTKQDFDLIASIFLQYLGTLLDIKGITICDEVSFVKDVTKVFFFSRKTTTEQVRQYWSEHFIVMDNSTGLPASVCGELMQKGVTKAKGMLDILTYYGSGAKDAIAIGDSSNDLEMLEAASVGIAMGNGLPSLKAHADFVTTDILEDGIRNAFSRYHLI